ncbi:MAG: YraN family protein, partial [Halanaerobiales bacterium]
LFFINTILRVGNLMNRRELGKFGEDKAVEYLKKQGYQIIERNFRYARAEIDIIASRDDFLAFVEVKLRRNLKYGLPQSAVDYRKQEKIKRAAQFYLMKNKNDKKIRFDVISIQINDSSGRLKHFENAF